MDRSLSKLVILYVVSHPIVFLTTPILLYIDFFLTMGVWSMCEVFEFQTALLFAIL